MFHAVWPEGQPEKAFTTNNGWKAYWHLMKCKLSYMFPWNMPNARRMRWSTAKEGCPIPTLVEQSLKDCGAIPPPEGWTEPLTVKTGAIVFGEVHTRTFSVI